MLFARLCRSGLAVVLVAAASVLLVIAPAHAAGKQFVLKAICVEAQTKFMTVATRAQCRAERGRFLDLTKRPVTLCVRTRAGVQRVSGAAVGTTKCARGDTPHVLNGERLRSICTTSSGLLRIPGAAKRCTRSEQRRVVRAGIADVTLTAISQPSLLVGSTATITYTLRNKGPVAATNVRVRLQPTTHLALGATKPGFGTTVTGSTWSARRVLPGSKVTLRVVVHGSSAGAASVRAVVGAMTQRDASGAVAVTKIAVVEPRLALSSEAFAFDPLVQGNASAPQTMTVRNAGTSPTGAISITRTGASVFAIGADQCTGVVLAPGAACTVGLTFEPLEVTASAATITVSAAGTNTVSANLSGAGLLSTLSVTPLTPTMLSLTANSTALAQFLLTNNADSTTSTIGVTAKGNGISVGASPCAGAVLAPHQSCVFSAMLTFTSLGLHTGSITARAGLMNASGELSITGTPDVRSIYSVTPDPVTFTPTLAGVAAPTEVITITNTGPTFAAQNLTPIVTGIFASEFVIIGNTCGAALAPGASCTLTVEHTPAFAGASNATITVAADNGDPATITLDGTGL